MAIVTDKHTGLKFVEPKTWQEGLVRLLAADAYRSNNDIGFGESGLVDHEINFLHKWCAKALRPLTAKQVRVGKERRRAQRSAAMTASTEASER
jgi:hypothetical protein